MIQVGKKLEALALFFLVANVGRYEPEVIMYHVSCLTEEDRQVAKSRDLRELVCIEVLTSFSPRKFKTPCSLGIDSCLFLALTVPSLP